MKRTKNDYTHFWFSSQINNLMADIFSLMTDANAQAKKF
jgi:hypothetical protein